MQLRLLVLGNARPAHVGGHFLRAGRALGLEVEGVDAEAAYAGPVWMRRLFWHLLGKRPPRLASVGRQVVERCRRWKPDLLLTTGLAPLGQPALREVRALGVPVANFLTDDPWNRAHHAPWFFRALPGYTHVFTPRHANEADLRSLGGPAVSWLPFAYSPEDHFPAPEIPEEERRYLAGRVALVGGADADRVRMVRVLVKAGVPVALWGGYWKDQPDLAPHAHGHADLAMGRRIAGAAGASLGLVRRANRDGHSMRSYELAACGASLLVEDTADHRALYGDEGRCAFYFDDDMTLAAMARGMLALPEENRAAMRRRAHAAVTGAPNTYADRLRTMLETLKLELP